MPKQENRGGLARFIGEYQGSREPLLRSLGASPHIELSSNTQVMVEGCTNILEYEDSCITLTAGRFRIRCLGSDLCIRSMQEQCALITGTVTALEYLSGEE